VCILLDFLTYKRHSDQYGIWKPYLSVLSCPVCESFEWLIYSVEITRSLGIKRWFWEQIWFLLLTGKSRLMVIGWLCTGTELKLHFTVNTSGTLLLQTVRKELVENTSLNRKTANVHSFDCSTIERNVANYWPNDTATHFKTLTIQPYCCENIKSGQKGVILYFL
jgi:hypothetical protein